MSSNALESNVVEMARLLQLRKNNRRTVLVLGSRAGGLFRSAKFFEIAQGFGSRSFSEFSGLPRIDQFGECYNTLGQKRFGETDLDSILTNSLKGLDFSKADNCLAELVKEGHFEMIISTNVDDLLERAFAHVGMREPHDFYVLIPKHVSDDKDLFRSGINISCTLIKAFGDQIAQEYRMIGQDLYLGNFNKLKAFLESTLAKSVLMVGLDPIWDQEMDSIFPKQGQEFWYVNEREPASSNIKQALNLRDGRFVVGGRGAYDSFIPELHSCITGRGPLSHELVRDMFNHLQEIREMCVQLRNEIAALQVMVKKSLKVQSGDQMQPQPNESQLER